MSLWSDFVNHTGRPAWKWTHYFPAYERHFGRFVNQPVTLLEIGCGQGGSLQLWRKYFGPFAQIVGVDIDPRCAEFAESQIEVRIGDQSDRAFLDSLIREFGSFDIVIDDGGHVMSHILTSFEALYPRTNAVYLIEDLHTAYWDEFEGGLRRPGTVIERLKELVDELHAAYTNGAVPRTEFSETTLSMHLYDSLVVFEKGRHVHKHALTYPTSDRSSSPWRRLRPRMR
jgi:SAM-dependent methyltransferase